jgi:hypothetical protein
MNAIRAGIVPDSVLRPMKNTCVEEARSVSSDIEVSRAAENSVFEIKSKKTIGEKT